MMILLLSDWRIDCCMKKSDAMRAKIKLNFSLHCPQCVVFPYTTISSRDSKVTIKYS